MERLTSLALKLKPLRRLVLDVRRCEDHELLQNVHSRWKISRYERAITRLHPITDIFVISFPKSGRTWHRFLLGNYLADLWDRPKAEAANVEKLTGAGLTRTRYDHNGANFADAISASHPTVADYRLWQGRKVIFLARNPKDVLVSAWHHARYRQSVYSGDISRFVRSQYAGIDKILIAHNRWWENRDRASDHLVLSYEQMHRDLAGVLRTTLEFVGWPIDKDAIARAAEASTFARMREAEKSGSVDHKSMQTHSGTQDRSDERSNKVRAGKVGGYKEHLSPDDIAYIETRISSLGNPFA